jgi:hypothetical protein
MLYHLEVDVIPTALRSFVERMRVEKLVLGWNGES